MPEATAANDGQGDARSEIPPKQPTINSLSGPIARWELRRLVSEVWAHWVQVVAIVTAGVWVAITFGIQYLPVREKQFVSESELRWTKGPTADTCIGEWYLKLRNNSRGSIDVRRVELRIWPYSLPLPRDDRPIFIDTEQFRPKEGTKNKYLFNRIYTAPEDGLVDRYSPDGESEGTFEWVFPQRQQPRWVTVEVELYEDTDGVNSLWFSSQTTRVCGALGSPNESDAGTSTPTDK